MKLKKIIALLFSTLLVGTQLVACGSTINNEMTATTRSKQEQTEYVIIDDEVTALIGSPEEISAATLTILEGINNERAGAGLEPLAQDEALMAAATIRAKEQVQSFSHTRPDGSEFWTVDSQVCYGECLSKGYTEPEVVNAWMNSPTHKAVILTPDYETMGVGVYREGNVCYIALETGY